MKGYTGEGRTLVADSLYSSLDLAHYLLENNTNLAGTLRQNLKVCLGMYCRTLKWKKMRDFWKKVIQV